MVIKAMKNVKSEGDKVVAVPCVICGYPNVVKVDKYGRYVTRCPDCGVISFYRSPKSMKWLESRFQAVSLEGIVV